MTQKEKTLHELLDKKANELQDMKENLEKFKGDMEAAASHKFPVRSDFDSDAEYLKRLEILAVE